MKVNPMTVSVIELGLLKFLKWYYDQKNNSFFSLDFKTMLTKH